MPSPPGSRWSRCPGRAACWMSRKAMCAWFGPGMYRFNTQRGMEGPVPLKKAPDWVKPAESQPERVKTLQAAVEKLRRGIAEEGVAVALAKAQKSKDSTLRIVATYSGIAVDN